MGQIKHNNADSFWSNAAARAIEVSHGIVDLLFIILMILLILFAGWAKWDAKQVYTAADPVQYLQYKPSPPYVVSFQELQAINPEVMGWLTVYDTNIDYPLVYDESGNEYYLNHNPKREVEASGSVFVDYRNSPDFTDFNTLIYGHHMAEHEMFGDIDKFLDEDFFNSHEYGNLIYNNQNHGLRFVAMLQVDAYDGDIYSPNIQSEERKLQYIDHLYENAVFVRGVDPQKIKSDKLTRRQEPIKSSDHLILLSTCSADITNGRFILVAKLLDHSVENPFPEEKHRIGAGIDTAKIAYTIGKLSITAWILILLGIILLVVILLMYLKRQRIRKEQKNNRETIPSAKE